MGAFDSLEDPFSEVGELAEDLGLADSEDLDEASSALQAMLAEKGVPPETYRFLFGEPRPGTVPTVSLDTEDLVTQAGHMLDNLCGGPGLGKVGAAIVNRELLTGETPKHEQPLWLVKDFRCEEGLSRLFRLDLTLRRPLSPELPAETAYAVDELGKALEFDKSNTGDGTYGISSTATDVAEAIAGAQAFAHKAMNPDDHLGEFSDAQDPDALDLEHFVPGDNPVDPAEFLERPCRLCVARRWPGDHFTLSERWFSGVCVELEDLGNAEPDHRVIRLVVAPRLWRLSQRAACRVFQNLNAVQIVLAILKEHGIYQDAEDAGEERVTSCLRIEPGGADLVGPVGVPDELAAMADKVAGAIPGGDGAMDFLKKSVEDWTPPREHCVQYGETDLEFVERLLAEEGITYYFEHSERRETLVLADDPKLAGRRTMTLDRRSLQARDGEPSGSELQKAELGWDFRVDRVLVPSAVTLRDFNPSNPTSVTEVQAGEQALKIAGGAGLETLATQAVGLVTEAGGAKGMEDYAGPEAKVFEYPAELTLEYDETPEKAIYETYDGPPLAQHALERFRSRGAAATLSSTVTLATPANTITVRDGGFDILQDGVRGDDPSTGGRGVVGVKQKVLITDVVHASSGSGYRNELRCLNAEVRFRPPRRRRRPVIAGVQSATVIDTAWSDGGEKPITGVASDDLDRVLVRFHWDRRARDTGDAEKAAHSCWVRVAQKLGGEGHGAVLEPRVGMEALVAFLEGNPDRPVIVGCLYNADRVGPSTYAPQPDRTDLPFTEPPRKPVTILRSRSWPQNGRDRGNELVFNDTGGHEEVTLFAQRDLEEKVGRDHVTTVLLDQTNTVGRDQLEKAAADQTLWVNHASTSTADPGRKKTVRGEHEKTTIGSPAAEASLEELVRKNSVVTVGGTRKDTVGEDETILVEGEATEGGGAKGGDPPKARSLTVRGSQKVAISQNDLLHVSGDCTVAAQGPHTITAKTITMSTSAGGDPAAADPESGIEVTDGAVKIASKGGVNLEAGETLEITSDTNAVLVTAPRKIVLQCGTDRVVLDGVAGTLTIQSQAGIKLGTPTSYLELQPKRLILYKGSELVVASAEGPDATAELQHPALITLDFDGEIHLNGQVVQFQRS